jgi:hypothetical protein
VRADEDEAQGEEGEVARQKIRAVVESLQQGAFMEQTLILTPRDRRSAAFFWLGVGVFPVFWSWFTMGRRFPKWQRNLALGWMLTVVTALVITWPQMAERYYLLPLKLPSVIGTLTVALWVWLALRLFPLGQLVMLFIVSIDIIAMLSSLCAPAYYRHSSAGFSPGMALMPLIPALLHFAVEPGHRLFARLKKIPADVRLLWICIATVPAFCVWFTFDTYFTKRERIIAWTWAVVHTTALLVLAPFLLYGPFIPISLSIALIAALTALSSRAEEGPPNDD